ncbi:MAG TPA: glyoxalase [Acidimicrobiaceae bacterium]|nr:glyoxalase [Acidimicrobiaceae bacterium]
MPEITGSVHHINVSVSDLERSRDWYQGLFGLQELARVSDQAGAWSKVILRHPSGLLFGLTMHVMNDSKPFSEWLCGFDHVALTVESSEAVRLWSARLKELGIDASEIKTTPLGSLITFRDPDSIQFELFAPH